MVMLWSYAFRWFQLAVLVGLNHIIYICISTLSILIYGYFLDCALLLLAQEEILGTLRVWQRWPCMGELGSWPPNCFSKDSGQRDWSLGRRLCDSIMRRTRVLQSVCKQNFKLTVIKQTLLQNLAP